MTFRQFKVWQIVLGTVALSFLGGCREDVSGPSESAQPFSMYGILNPRTSTQTLLVTPVQNVLGPLPDSIDAAVTSTEVGSGKVRVWSDSIYTNDIGESFHIFWADFQPEYESRHRIDAVRSDGLRSTVEVLIPPLVTIEQDDTGTRFFFVDIHGHDLVLHRIDVTYTVRFYDVFDDRLAPPSSYIFSHLEEELDTDIGWRIPINLARTYDTMRSLYFEDHYPHNFQGFENPECDGLALFSMRISVTVGNEAWNPPGGVFDPAVLVQHGALANVENGYGFVGGGYKFDDVNLYPSIESMADTWFFDFTQQREPERSPACGA